MTEEKKERREDIDLFSREAQANAAYEKIKDRKVTVVGCGNVGTVVATILAESGIKDMNLIDFDDFSYVDNRQLYSTEENIGKNKAIATAVGVAERANCYVKPYNGNAVELFANGIIDLKDQDIFMCVDSVPARKDIFENAMYSVADERKSIGKILDVGVENNTIQVIVYDTKKPVNVYGEDDGAAHCVAVPLASFRAFMGASLMVGAYFSLFETDGEEDDPMVPPDHALQIYTNTMEKFLRPI